MKNVLVTGGAGFMGSNFIHYLLGHEGDVSVVNLDALTYAGNPENLSGVDEKRYRFVQGDIADEKLARELMRDAEWVVNFAAETHVDRSIHGKVGDFVHTNIEGVHVLLEALRDAPNVKKMLHVSTDEVWGSLELDAKEQFNEESPVRPNSPYAASKAAGDLLVRAYVKTYRLPVVVSHSVNNFGPRQFPEKIIPFFALQALQDKPLPLYGDGKYVRDWLYVDDHSAAILMLLKKGDAGEVYAVSAGQECANDTLAKKILSMLGKSENLLAHVEDRPGHDRRYSVDSSKLRALGWEPSADFGGNLKETLRWYQTNGAWLESATSRSGKLNPHITV